LPVFSGIRRYAGVWFVIRNFRGYTKENELQEAIALERYLSVLALLLFFALLGGRSLALSKRGIKAIVFGETDKSDFLLVPVFLVIVYTVFACAFGLPMPAVLVHPFWTNTAIGWLGLTLCTAALIGFAVTLKSFGDSFRVGIDEKKPDKLVTSGMFAISRNPIYVCFLLFFSGMFLLYPNITLACMFLLLTLAIHRQILREEAFLKAHYGKDYEDYCQRVRRYL
jgi:protein-S-isoprenylcysteine O-methyltransferase Ste14